MEMTEGKQRDVSEAGQGDPNIVVVKVAEEQHRGMKRHRRDRGSTAKDRISKMPPCVAGKRSSIYRGVTRHRWTGRYEAHLWDKSTWNHSQNKKGKQVYLGAYDEEEAAARAYDLAALKYWGPGTLINFTLSDYARDIEEMQNVTREEYLQSLRRKSSGFSRGVSKNRGVARHHHNGRWEARIGRVFGNKYLYLGTYSAQDEAAAACDMATIEYRGLNAVTNFDLSRFIPWLRPGHGSSGHQETYTTFAAPTVGTGGGGGEKFQPTGQMQEHHRGEQEEHPQHHHSQWTPQFTRPYLFPSLGYKPSSTQERSSTALNLLLQSSMFKQVLERASAAKPAASNSPSKVFSAMEQHQHDSSQHQDNDVFNRSWGQQMTSRTQQESPLFPKEAGSSAHHLNSMAYPQSTSNYPYVASQDHKHQHRPGLQHRQQQQDHLSVVFGPVGSHDSASTLAALSHGTIDEQMVPWKNAQRLS